jgi:hypothetical protein
VENRNSERQPGFTGFRAIGMFSFRGFLSAKDR